MPQITVLKIYLSKAAFQLMEMLNKEEALRLLENKKTWRSTEKCKFNFLSKHHRKWLTFIQILVMLGYEHSSLKFPLKFMADILEGI